jgi:hypothetical protein
MEVGVGEDVDWKFRGSAKDDMERQQSGMGPDAGS